MLYWTTFLTLDGVFSDPHVWHTADTVTEPRRPQPASTPPR